MATGVGREKILTTLSDSADPKYEGKCKQHAIIFHVGRVIVNFVPKFVAMATGVGRGEIKMTLSDSLGPKRGVGANSAQLSLRGPSYTALKSPLAVMQNFATFKWLLWQQGSLKINLNDTVKLSDPENRQSAQLSFTGTELYRFESPIGRIANFKNWGKIKEGAIRFLSQTRSYFSGSESLCKISSRSNQNCGCIGVFTDRRTDRMTEVIL